MRKLTALNHVPYGDVKLGVYVGLFLRLAPPWFCHACFGEAVRTSRCESIEKQGCVEKERK
jgi:hypothetical protein